MPYPAEHATRTKKRIVDSARRLFNKHGFEPVSIDQIMGEAGLTRGGFYHHFKSKDELYAAAVSSFQSCNPFRERLAGMTPSQLQRTNLARLSRCVRRHSIRRRSFSGNSVCVFKMYRGLMAHGISAEDINVI